MKNDVKVDGKKQKGNLPIIVSAALLSVVLWVSISLSEQYFITINIPLKIINLPDGYSVGSNVPETISLRIKSRGWNILELQQISNPIFYASASNEPGKSKINLKSSLAENGWLSSEIQVLEISPEAIQLNLDKTVSKFVKVKSEALISFKDGYGLARPPVLVPDSIKIFATKTSIDGIDFVKTTVKLFDNTDEAFSTTLQLTKIPGVEYDASSVECYFDVQKIVDHDFENIPVTVINVPPDRKVVLSPGQITIGVKGGINVLAKLNDDNFKAVIDYKDILNDTLGVLAPSIILPSYVEKNYIKPEFVKPIIKKY
jgi:YbbR domain-containing protein